MIKDHTIDQCLVELARTMAALKALRTQRKACKPDPLCKACARDARAAKEKGRVAFFPASDCTCRETPNAPQGRQHATALRASLDLTRKLADLRQGR